MQSVSRWVVVAFAARALAACGSERPVSLAPPAPLLPRFVARSAARPPPPIAGGTLLALRGGVQVAAADPDHDVVWLVDLRASTTRRVPLSPRDEPGRLAQDDAGRLHVVLRGAGAVATIDTATASVTERRTVCPAPRGIAWNPAASALEVVCVGGEFVVLPATGPARAVRHLPARDLRDVVVVGDTRWVTEFRSAVAYHGAADRDPVTERGESSRPTPQRAVAWRMAPVLGGGVVVLSGQLPSGLSLGGAPSSAGYYGDVARSSIPIVPLAQLTDNVGRVTHEVTLPGGFAVDVAAMLGGGGWRVAVAFPGWAFGQGPASVQEWNVERSGVPPETSTRIVARPPLRIAGQAIAVTYTEGRELVIQTRAPGRIVTATREIVLYDDNVADQGHDVFHATTNSGLACASCHPEGNDDGLTWSFVGTGIRRTHSLRGGLLQTAPFHWDGDAPDFTSLCNTVFTQRMGGGPLHPSQAQAMGRWLDGLAAIPPSVRDADAVTRGEALFRSPTTRCAVCHSGPMYTDNRSHDVGTPRRAQTPSLVGVGHRAPYFHHGCAPTLRAVFTLERCRSGSPHGDTSTLRASEFDDLVAFLESR